MKVTCLVTFFGGYCGSNFRGLFLNLRPCIEGNEVTYFFHRDLLFILGVYFVQVTGLLCYLERQHELLIIP